MLRPLAFSDRDHQILCEELKTLYTAVTRARVRVVFYDSDERKRAPMFHVLRSSGLVDSISLFSAAGGPDGLFSGASAGALGAQVRAQQWRQQGVTLRERGLYELAAKCFLQSGDAAARLEVMGQQARRLALRESGRERRQVRSRVKL